MHQCYAFCRGNPYINLARVLLKPNMNKMKNLKQPLYLLFVIVLGNLVACNNKHPDKETNVSGTLAEAVGNTPAANPPTEKVASLKINLKEILAKKTAPKAQKVVVEYDQVLKTKKKYMGYRLKEVIQPYVERLNTPDNHKSTLVTFMCSDGFNPNRKLNDLLKHDGYIVFKDLAQPEGKNWADSLVHSYAPYYLVWKGLAKYDEAMWPHGLEYIKLNISDKLLFQTIAPKSETATAGFQLFKKYCITCHSINKVGGELAPDLNYPKNILEYWDKKHVREFIANPKSYRYNSKMSKLDITPKEIDQIVAYIDQMQQQKVK